MNWTEEQLRERNQRIFDDRKAEVEKPLAPLPDASEAQIQEECTKLMQEDGWRALRTDPVSDKSRGKGFGELGMADYLYIRYLDGAEIHVPFPGGGGRTRAVPKRPAAELLWIEWKAPRGKPKSHQVEWHRNERARGALTWIAGVDFPASVDGFRAHYRASGLNRGRV